MTTSSPSRKATARNPSHLGSYCQPTPVGNSECTLAAIDPSLDIAMTTNGILLREKAQALRDAGLRRLNVSLDTLHSDRFRNLARRDALDRVLDGLAAAREAGFEPIKLNMVVMRGRNDDEILDFAKLARREGYQVRFIEFMPLDADGIWSP